MSYLRCVLVLVLCLCLVGVEDAHAAKKGRWVKVSSKGGVLVHKMKVPGSKLFAFRGEMVADIHIAKLITILITPKYRKKWIDRYHSSGRIAMPSKIERIYWIRFDFPWPAWDRDFVMYTRAVPDLKRRIFTALIKSIKHKKRPKNKCCVRAEAIRTYYQFKALKQKKGGGPKTRIIVEVHTDPKGWLPKWIINNAQKNWPRKTLRNLVKTARNAKKYPLMRKWHSPKPLNYPDKMVKEYTDLVKQSMKRFP